MLKNLVRAKHTVHVEYELLFDDGCGNGYGFPCDGLGRLLSGLTEEAMANYEWCMKHPEKFERFDEVFKMSWPVTEPGHGTCTCGTEVELWDQYMGACQCPKCGRWYNLFGQSLVDPKYWEED